MIDLGSIAGLREHDHGPDAYCPSCDQWVSLDLAAMISAGHRALRLPVRVLCQVVG